MNEVNGQIVDAIAMANTQVLSSSPAVAMANLYQAIGYSTGMAAANAVYAQQQANIAFQAATTLGVTLLLSSSP